MSREELLIQLQTAHPSQKEILQIICDHPEIFEAVLERARSLLVMQRFQQSVIYKSL